MKISFNLTWKKTIWFIFIFLLVGWIIFFLTSTYTERYFSSYADFFLSYLKSSVQESSFIGLNSIALMIIFLGQTTLTLVFSIMLPYIIFSILYPYDKTPQEKEIEEATKKINDKYKLMRLEKRIAKLKGKKK